MSLPITPGTTYARHNVIMCRWFGLPDDSNLDVNTATNADIYDVIRDETNPQKAKALSYLHGVKWGLWNMIQVMERPAEMPALTEIAEFLHESEQEEAIRKHTAKILRTYYASIDALERTLVLNLAMEDIKRIDQLPKKLRLQREQPKQERAAADHKWMIHKRYNLKIPGGVAEVESQMASNRFSVHATAFSVAHMSDMNAHSIIASGKAFRPSDILRRHLGDNKEGVKYYMQQLAHRVRDTARFLSLLDIQSISLNKEILLASKKLNQIPGKTADKRTLLVDRGIPTPNDGTILGWFALCNLGAYEDSEGNQYFAAILPHMPMTFEHKNHGGITDVASDADHSLPSKSAGHARGKFGEILYGHRIGYGIKVRKRDGAIQTTYQMLHNGAISPNHASHDILVSLYRDNRAMKPSRVIPGPEYDQFIKLPWHDPFSYGEIGASLHWYMNHRASYADEPMRALAKQNLHFRFDDLEAACEWGEKYAQAIRAYIRTNPILYDLKSLGTATVLDSINPDNVLATKGANRGKIKLF